MLSTLTPEQIIGFALCAALTLGGLAFCAGQARYGWGRL